MKRAAAVAVVVSCVAASSRAGAVEREHHVGIDAGAAILVASDKSGGGAAAGAHWTYGLSDAWNLMLEGAFSTTSPTVGNVGAGVAYVLDVLRWVPYAGLLAEGYAVGGDKWLGGAAIALGLDYRFSRTVAAGFAIREHTTTLPRTYPSFTQALARLEYTWGW